MSINREFDDAGSLIMLCHMMNFSSVECVNFPIVKVRIELLSFAADKSDDMNNQDKLDKKQL